MLDSVPTHIKGIQRNHIFGEVVPDAVICPKLSRHGLLRSEQIRNLHVELFSPLVAHKVDLLVPCSSHGDGIASAQQFQIHDILKNPVDIPRVAAENRFTNAMVGNVVLLVGSKYLLAVQVLPFDLIEQIGFTAVFNIR